MGEGERVEILQICLSENCLIAFQIYTFFLVDKQSLRIISAA